MLTDQKVLWDGQILWRKPPPSTYDSNLVDVTSPLRMGSNSVGQCVLSARAQRPETRGAGRRDRDKRQIRNPAKSLPFLKRPCQIILDSPKRSAASPSTSCMTSQRRSDGIISSPGHSCPAPGNIFSNNGRSASCCRHHDNESRTTYPTCLTALYLSRRDVLLHRLRLIRCSRGSVYEEALLSDPFLPRTSPFHCLVTHVHPNCITNHFHIVMRPPICGATPISHCLPDSAIVRLPSSCARMHPMRSLVVIIAVRSSVESARVVSFYSSGRNLVPNRPP
jgi:hypothetical protein